MQYTTAQQRRWAHDQYETFRGTKQEDMAAAIRDKIIAKADLEDDLIGNDHQIADTCEVTHEYPVLGAVTLHGGRRTGIQFQFTNEISEACEARGIHVAFAFRSYPTEIIGECGELVYLYIGTKTDGPIAQYAASDRQWYELKSKGNFGKKYAFGGNWSSRKIDTQPKILEVVMKISDRIRKARANYEAAKLRVLAASQRQMVAGYNRQAEHPAYPGQECVCIGKADQVAAFAAKTEAQADLILAEAGL